MIDEVKNFHVSGLPATKFSIDKPYTSHKVKYWASKIRIEQDLLQPGTLEGFFRISVIRSASLPTSGIRGDIGRNSEKMSRIAAQAAIDEASTPKEWREAEGVPNTEENQSEATDKTPQAQSEPMYVEAGEGEDNEPEPLSTLRDLYYCLQQCNIN